VLSEPHGSNLLISCVHEPALDLVQETLERLGRNRALHAGSSEASKQLGAVVGLTAAVVLDDQRQRLFHPFVRGVAPFAMLTLAPASRNFSSLRKARVDHTVFQRSTVGAAHIRAQASARAEPGQRSAPRSRANEADERLQVGCVGKHVESDEAVYAVAFRRSEAEVARERCGVAGDIDHALRAGQQIAVLE